MSVCTAGKERDAQYLHVTTWRNVLEMDFVLHRENAVANRDGEEQLAT